MMINSDYMMCNRVSKYKPMEPDDDWFGLQLGNTSNYLVQPRYELQDVANLISRLNMSSIPRPDTNSALKQLGKRIEELEKQVKKLTRENEVLKTENQLLRQNVENKNKKIVIK